MMVLRPIYRSKMLRGNLPASHNFESLIMNGIFMAPWSYFSVRLVKLKKRNENLNNCAFLHHQSAAVGFNHRKKRSSKKNKNSILISGFTHCPDVQVKIGGRIILIRAMYYFECNYFNFAPKFWIDCIESFSPTEIISFYVWNVIPDYNINWYGESRVLWSRAFLREISK